MSKVASALKEEIARVARKEAKALVDPLKKQVFAQRSIIKDLKQQLAESSKQLHVVVREMTRGASKTAAQTQSKPASSGPSTKSFMALRKRLKLTREGMAKALDVSPQTIYNWERGTKPNEKYLPRIAKLEARSNEQAAVLAGTGKVVKSARMVKKPGPKKAATKKALVKKDPVKKALTKSKPLKRAPTKNPSK